MPVKWNLRKTTGFNIKMRKNSKFQKVKTRSKIYINHLQDLNNIRKPMFHDSRTNSAQDHILKKRVAKKYWKSQIFWISKKHKMAGIGRNRPISTSKAPACSKVLPKIFCRSRTKNSWNYSKNATPPTPKGHFFGGG